MFNTRKRDRTRRICIEKRTFLFIAILYNHRFVGDKLLPLVATVPYQKTSEPYDETFYAVENIHYIPVQTKAFQNVKVHLKSSTEEFIPFEHGRAAITLHLKPLNYFD